MSRRARLRSVAPPILRLVTIPTFHPSPDSSLRQFRMRHPQTRRCPSSRTCANTRAPRNRRLRPKVRRWPDGLGVGTISNGRQPFAALLTTAADHGSPALRGHPGAESQLPFPADFRGLILTFHGLKSEPVTWRPWHPHGSADRPGHEDSPLAAQSRRRYQRRGGCQETAAKTLRITGPPCGRNGGFRRPHRDDRNDRSTEPNWSRWTTRLQGRRWIRRHTSSPSPRNSAQGTGRP